MTFKTGQSGNPTGRPKGSLSRRVQLAKLLEPHAKELVEKMIELALNGDTHALRLCIERLIPKVQREPIIELLDHLDPATIPQWKDAIVRAAINGQMSIDDAEKLIKLIDNQKKQEISISAIDIITNDPNEAARVYQRLMG